MGGEKMKSTLFQVAPEPAASQGEGSVGGLKAWATPKVIVSELADAEAANSPSNDGSGTGQGS